jgi:hypothetical protein
MLYIVNDIAHGKTLQFQDEEESIQAFEKLYIPRYRALIKKLGHEPNEKERKAIRQVITKKIVSYEYDFSDDLDENGNLREGVLEREGLAFDENGNLVRIPPKTE